MTELGRPTRRPAASFAGDGAHADHLRRSGFRLRSAARRCGSSATIFFRWRSAATKSVPWISSSPRPCARGADTLVTGAGPLSNHVRASAAVAALTGLRCIAVYWGAAPARAEGNYWLTRMLGAEIRFTGDSDRASVDRGVEAAVGEIVARGGRPYAIPRGGACALAVLAHVLAVRETLEQCAALGVDAANRRHGRGRSGDAGGLASGLGAVWRSMAPRRR